MDEVDAMIIDIAPLRIGHRRAGELAVNGIEKGHRPARDDPGDPRANPEKLKGDTDQHQAECGHSVRLHADGSRPARDVKGRPGPGIFRDDVCHTLVGALELSLFDDPRRGGENGERVGRLSLA